MPKEIIERKVFRFMRATGQLDVLGVDYDQIDRMIEAAAKGQKTIQEAINRKLGKREDVEDESDTLKMVAKLIWPKEVLADLITFMAEHFSGQYTEQELDALIDFYESDIGQKYKVVNREFALLLVAKIGEMVAENVPGIDRIDSELGSL